MSTKLSLFSTTPFSFHTELPSTSPKIPVKSTSPLILPSNHSHTLRPKKATGVLASCVTAAQAEIEVEVEVGYRVTQFCDKIIDVFLNEKPKSKDWKKFLVLREDWKKYSERFYHQCKTRANAENDSGMKRKLIDLSRKVKKIDDEMERHTELLKELQVNPTDVNAIVAKRRKDFTGEFFRYLTLLTETYDSLEDRDGNVLFQLSHPQVGEV